MIPIAPVGHDVELAMSTRGASLWVRKMPTGLRMHEKRFVILKRAQAGHDPVVGLQLRAALPMPQYTTSSSGRSATPGSRLFITCAGVLP